MWTKCIQKVELISFFQSEKFTVLRLLSSLQTSNDNEIKLFFNLIELKYTTTRRIRIYIFNEKQSSYENDFSQWLIHQKNQKSFNLIRQLTTFVLNKINLSGIKIISF